MEEGYLRSIPPDPITQSTETWEVVLEDLGADEAPAETDLPEDGAPGVVDVFSGAEALALDGSSYSEW